MSRASAPAAIARQTARTAWIVLALACAACGSSSGGGGVALPTGRAGATDTACNAAIDVEGCHNRERMLCDNGTGTWQLLDECPTTQVCNENGMAEQPGSFLTMCADPPQPADAVGGDDAIVGGSDTVGGGVPPTTADVVCKRWKDDRAELGEGQFSGNIAKCDAGDISDTSKDHAVKLVNLYRWLVNLPPVTRDPANDAKAQQCALMMAANGQLSHTPPNTWKCWTEDGALAAKRSNISTAPGVTSVDRYVIDSGANNHATLGHRRWILSNSLGPIGVGSTGTKASCLWVIGGNGNSKPSFTAWPPAGKVPLKAFAPYGKESIDQTGWSIQSDSLILTKAKIRVTNESDTELPVTQWQLGGGYGSKYAIAFTPNGWKTEGDRSYTVHVDGVAKPFSYNVEVLACQ